MWPVIILSLMTMGVTLGLAYWFSSPNSRLAFLDHPNERSLHTRPVPRTGGMAIMVGFLVGLTLAFSWLPQNRFYDEAAIWVLGGMLGIALFSFWDDRVGLPAVSRFALHAVVAVGVIWGGGLSIRDLDLPFIGVLSFSWFSVPLTILFLMWMTNLYNFMDGMDGFAGGMTVFGFACLAYLGWIGGHQGIFLVALLMAVSAMGFLIWNFPPAKIFMGDVGSTAIGFLAGGLAILGVHDGLFDLWVPVLIFSPFIIDSTVTLFRRLFNGKKFWQAHREHYYQRLVLAGWGHRKTVIAEYLLMSACGISAILYLKSDVVWQDILLIGWGVLYLLIAYGVKGVEKNYSVK